MWRPRGAEGPYGHSASPALNNVECWATKKIIFSLASRPGQGIKSNGKLRLRALLFFIKHKQLERKHDIIEILMNKKGAIFDEKQFNFKRRYKTFK